MDLVIAPRRDHSRAVYSEEIELDSLGHAVITRASHVEPGGDGGWHADLSPVAGPVLGPFARRSEALAAERAWLEGALAHDVVVSPARGVQVPRSMSLHARDPTSLSSRSTYVRLIGS